MSVYSVNVYPSSTTIKTDSWYYNAYAVVNASSNCCEDVEWYSDSPCVASVNKTQGYIYGISPGTAKIYAISTVDSSKKDYITVTVTSGQICVDSVTLNRSSISLEKGDTFDLCATVCPTNATNKSISWLSTNTNVATVSDGVVTAKARGCTYIFAEAKDGSGEYDYCYVNVTEDILVSSVTLNYSSYTLNANGSVSLRETVCPTDATNKCVEWTSDKPHIAFVNPDSGFVTAQGAGTATITATATDGSEKYGECTITVNPPIAVSGIDVCPTCLTMNVGDVECLFKEITPGNATNQTVTWCSSNENVATVGLYTGKVTAKKVGTTTITATTVDGEFTACCAVTVNPLLIYQTRDTEVKWFNPDVENATEEIREDMLYNHWSKEKIMEKVPTIDDEMFVKDGNEVSVADRKASLVSMTTTWFANGTFEPIITDMINHFMREKNDNFDGTCDGYDLYFNSNLTEEIKKHTESKTFIRKNKTVLKKCLENNDGSISNLKYDPSLRFNVSQRDLHEFVKEAQDDEIELPLFDDLFKGFKICVDSLQGAKIEVLSYNLDGNSYSGKMKFTYYDHFGLDVADLTKSGFQSIVNDMKGFKNWFILQHYNNLNVDKHPKPFVTVMEIEESFSGEI